MQYAKLASSDTLGLPVYTVKDIKHTFPLLFSQCATKPASQMFYRINEVDMPWLLYGFVYK